MLKTKFIVANETGILHLQDLARTTIKERFTGQIDTNELENYIESRYNTQTIISELNDFSNQCIIVYFDDKPAGFAYFSDKGQKPDFLTAKRTKHLVQFEILSVFKNTGAAEMLLEKCINVSKTCAALWLEEPTDSPISGLLNANGFVIEKPVIPVHGLPVESVLFVKYF
ncbi:GNAT family N-acetyltransferase [Dyadobacter sp. LHD-138]|uniref:GNAT family N-acetyltransferase n=1 Tax=Dyadobacter sp. LHD-138 TaxID=3071413 RepID=UPI0027E19E6A|nr:GNAT family N-acetyltransferase [Dyadobacter sp. LHD-138]MDQ6479340.1 hypothetical protein [Dyadobacter sp. LHD-138]